MTSRGLNGRANSETYGTLEDARIMEKKHWQRSVDAMEKKTGKRVGASVEAARISRTWLPNYLRNYTTPATGTADDYEAFVESRKKTASAPHVSTTAMGVRESCRSAMRKL